jgi:hypothetical protein
MIAAIMPTDGGPGLDGGGRDDAGAGADGQRPGRQVVGGVVGRHPAGRQQVDLGIGTVQIGQVLRTEPAGREDLHSGRAEVDRRGHLGRGEGAEEDRDAGVGGHLRHRGSQPGGDQEPGAGVHGAAGLLRGHHGADADRQAGRRGLADVAEHVGCGERQLHQAEPARGQRLAQLDGVRDALGAHHGEGAVVAQPFEEVGPPVRHCTVRHCTLPSGCRRSARPAVVSVRRPPSIASSPFTNT